MWRYRCRGGNSGHTRASCLRPAGFLTPCSRAIWKRKTSPRWRSSSPSAMELVLEFVYTGEGEIKGESALDLLTAANYLLMAKLEQRAVRFLKENWNVSNCIVIYYSAMDRGFSDLRCSAREFIQANFLSVSGTREFLDLSLDQVKEWLSSDDVVLGDEKDVFKIVLKWIESDESREREANFPELFQCVRLIYVSRDYFFSETIPHRLVQDNPECLRAALDSMRSLAQVSDGGVPEIDQRKCLRTHAHAMVLFGAQTGGTLACFFPKHNSWYQLHRVTCQRYMRLNSCRGSLYLTGHLSIQRFDPLS